MRTCKNYSTIKGEFMKLLLQNKSLGTKGFVPM